MGVLEKIFGSHSERELKRIVPIVDKIEALEPSVKSLSDEQLRAKTDEFRERLNKGETLDDILPEAYAVVREAAIRTLGQRHFRVQLMGGVILHQGRIAEMRTGEGKTLVSTLPAYLNALTGKGVHIVTVNDYLANRDSEWMGQIHRFLGLSVGVVLNDMPTDERRAAYQCDITYATNNELGFDYLRDNMVIYKEKRVQGELNYAIIDEVDSVLVDEARTPLIISGQSGKSTQLYSMADYIARHLVKGREIGEQTKLAALMNEEVQEEGDFVVDEKTKAINLTEQGVKKVEEFFKLENLADPENMEIQHHVNIALRAHNLMHKDQDYVVKEDQILIVDEFTGRIMNGRRYSDGLHQAIEAKEGVKVQRESKTLATITFQNFFNKYKKKSGMTGTAQTEEQEFRGIYELDVVVVPTNKPVLRVDYNDSVYTTLQGKMEAIINEIVETYKTGQPVLVGTITIESSEEISEKLKKRHIPHKVLNAKYHEMEAEIVAEAGQKGAVTIATNMAGRGTDIKLGEEVAELGGLKIIGTERHESRRIDNQLRGRAGRQGDQGSSKFYISLEDELMRLFGSERLMSMFRAMGVQENEEIQHKLLSNSIERAQKKIENNNFGIRKNLLEYDKVMNEQREIIYGERSKVLNGESMRDVVLGMVSNVVGRYVDEAINMEHHETEWDISSFNDKYTALTSLPRISLDGKSYHSKEEFKEAVIEETLKAYEEKETQFEGEEQVREVERVILLRVIDRRWMDHIDDMDQMRQGIGLQAYAQKDPLIEYKFAGYDMFDEMSEGIEEDTVRSLFHIRVEQKVEREEVAKVTGTNKSGQAAAKEPYKRSGAKVNRNDPCPCGSGLKYKHCCGK